MKFIISYMFANASHIDFSEPLSFIDRNISYLLDNTLDELKNGAISEPLNILLNSSISLKVNEQSLFMETPNKLELALIKEGSNGMLTYTLPTISYAIKTNDAGTKACYVYSIQNSKDKKIDKSDEQIKYEKKIAREMYKINAGVIENESEEYKEYVNNKTDYYPENISDVSPSAVISATILIGILSQEDITDIKIVDFLPVRWHAKDYAITKMLEQHPELDEEELREKHILIQRNITDKFLRTFRRLAFHFNGLKIQSYPKEIDDYMNIYFDNQNTYFNNQMLQQIYDKTQDIEYKKNKII